MPDREIESKSCTATIAGVDARCPLPVHCRGLCERHYQQVRRRGRVTSVGPVEAAADLTPYLLRLPPWLLETIRQAAELDGVSVAEWMREALTHALPLAKLAEQPEHGR